MNFSGISRVGVIGQVLRLPLRFIPDNAVMPILQGQLKGYKWITGSSTHGCWLGSYEFVKQRFISDVVSEGDIVFDIGAHVGFYTLLFSRLVGTTGKVVAFEPFSPNIRYLKQHLRLNHITNVDLFEAAVTDHMGTAFFEEGPSSSMGHLTEKNEQRTQEVQVVSIDTLIADGKLPIPNYIKLDIEGAEHLALVGALETLRNHHPKIFLATHGQQVHQACCTLLTELGYKLEPVTGVSISDTDELIAR